MNTQLFSQYETTIRNLTATGNEEALLLARSGRLSVHYAPFEWVNSNALVVLVGITPGRTQMKNALNEAKRQLAAGGTCEQALKAALQTGAFSGAMRNNLIGLLNRVGLHERLGLTTCRQLFDSSAALLQSCSVLPFPVFVDGSDYNGTPDPLKEPLLRNQIYEHFVPTARALARAVFVPLGKVPTKVLFALSAEGLIARERILDGLPHPSGANAERISYFLGQKERTRLSSKTDPVRLDAARTALTRQVSALASFR